MPPGAAPPKKKSAMPWILGCGGCLGLVVIGFIALAALGYMGSKNQERGGSGRQGVVDTENTTLYTVTEDGLAENLRQYFVPVSFRYPSDWRVVQRGDEADAQNFVKVEKGAGGNTAENFAVGYLTIPEGHEDDSELLGNLLSQLEQQFSQQFPNFQRVGSDRMTLSGHQATGFRFTAKQNDVDIFGRVLLLPIGGGKGVSVVMLGTPLNSGLSSVDDLGEKGGLPTILRTLRVGGDVEAAGAADSSAAAGEEKPAAASDEPAGQTTDAAPADASQPSDDAQPADDSQPADNGGEPDIKEIKPLRP